MTGQALRLLDDTQARGRPVIQREGDFVGPLFYSFGDLDLLCGACGFVLIRGVRSSSAIYDAIVECPGCGARNESWDSEEHDFRDW